MKLDRNIPHNLGRGKYALILRRRLAELIDQGNGPLIARANAALNVLGELGMLDYGDTPQTEFFVIRLKDKYAAIGLESYAMAAVLDDPEYAEEIMELASHAGPNSPHCKAPD